MSYETATSFPGEPTSRHFDVVGLTQELIRRPSYQDSEQVVSFVEDAIASSDTGLQTRRIKTSTRHNDSLLIGTDVSGRLPEMIGIAHIDTVNPGSEEDWEHGPFSGDLVDGEIIGRGAADSKGSAAAMLCAASESDKEVAVFFTSDEEGKLRGTKAVAKFVERNLTDGQGSKDQTYTVISAGSYDEFATGSRGVAEVKATIVGESGHGGHRSSNMLDVGQAIRAYNALLEHGVTNMPISPVFGEASMNTGFLRAGKVEVINGRRKIVGTVNQIPDQGDITYSIRLNGEPMNGEPVTPQSLEAMLEKVIAEHNISIRKFDSLLHIDAAITDPQKVAWAVDIIKRITGRDEIPFWDYPHRGLEEAVALIPVLGADTGLLVWGAGPKSLYHHPTREAVPVENLQNANDAYREIFNYATK